VDVAANTELVWERERAPRPSVVVAAFSGYFDGASAATGAIAHLVEHSGATRLAHIDGDRFLDSQQVRPQVSLDEGVTRRITWPENVAYANDEASPERELVLVTGVEPHYSWRDFVGLLLALAEHASAQVVVTLGASAAATPHTRPPRVRASSADAELAARLGLHRPRYEGITGIIGVLQAELDARGMPAIAMQAPVPYYASGSTNWKAAAALLQHLEHVTGIDTGHRMLDARVAAWERMVDEAVSESEEARAYLPQLEAQYDREVADDVPSSDDLVAELERYLREQTDPPGES
jgi:proteasome assembly chaperone (PAC2) family protein